MKKYRTAHPKSKGKSQATKGNEKKTELEELSKGGPSRAGSLLREGVGGDMGRERNEKEKKKPETRRVD